MKNNKNDWIISFILEAICSILLGLVVSIGIPMLLETEVEFVTHVFLFDIAFFIGVAIFTKILEPKED